MNEISDENLLTLNNLGIIPGPKESTNEFLERAEHCLQICNHCKNLPFPFEANCSMDPSMLEKGLSITSKLYDLAPTWVPIVFSNYKLTPWHGGCTWIYKLDEGKPSSVILQLRKNFSHLTKYLCIYDKNELIAHELVHIGRMEYNEPKFEEMLAYQASSSLFRRLLGPILQSSFEGVGFVIFLFLLTILDVFLFTIENARFVTLISWMHSIPLLVIVVGLLRLKVRHKIYSNCLLNLSVLVNGNVQKARAIIYRLTDEEISSFSKMDLKGIKKYALEQSLKSLRWRLIKSAYLAKMSYTK